MQEAAASGLEIFVGSRVNPWIERREPLITPLQAATQNNQSQVIEFLVSQGENSSTPIVNGSTGF
jgi:hypothetical protein